jgi:hypothetical protein
MIARAISQELRALTPRLNPMPSARVTAASQLMMRCGKAAPKALPESLRRMAAIQYFYYESLI